MLHPLKGRKQTKEHIRKRSLALKGKSPSVEVRKQISQTLTGRYKGKTSPHWKKDYSYMGLHAWIGRVYGKATHCENPKCLGKSKIFQWALKKSVEKALRYLRRRNNFKMLCAQCHRKYDATPERDHKISQTIKKLWNDGHYKNRAKPKS